MSAGGRARARVVRVGFLAALVASAGILAACSEAGSGSRHTLYDSIESLAADSSSIVVGDVTAQSVEGDVTISSVAVTNAPANPRLGSDLADAPEPAAVGETVEVRQEGSPTLEVGGEYLLFLTPTMLPGEAAAQFFVTGAVAGLYVREDDGFRRVVPDSGDDLPATITATGDAPG